VTPAVQVLYFAWVRQKVGVAEERVSPPAEVADVAGLVRWLSGRSPGHAAAFENAGAIRAAVNQEFATPDRRLSPGDEVAFFPPVTGG
jgi:molybdopterin converting factor subunit 1